MTFGAVFDCHCSTQQGFTAAIYQRYGKRLADKTPAMQRPIPRKDLGLFKHIADQVGSPSPIADQLLALVERTA